MAGEEGVCRVLVCGGEGGGMEGGGRGLIVGGVGEGSVIILMLARRGSTTPTSSSSSRVEVAILPSSKCSSSSMEWVGITPSRNPSTCLPTSRMPCART